MTIYDRLFSAFFIVFATAITLAFGPFLSGALGRGGGFDAMVWEYQFILEWWPSIFFGSAFVGFVFGVDRVLDFFGFIWGTVEEHEMIQVVLVLFVLATITYALVFQ